MCTRRAMLGQRKPLGVACLASKEPEQQTFDVIGFLHHRARVPPCDDRAQRLQLAV